jgi:hypothetical protein
MRWRTGLEPSRPCPATSSGSGAAFKTGNINGVLSTLADDVGWSILGPKDIVPFVGQRQGYEQVAQVIARFAEMHDGEQFKVQGFVTG